MVFQICEHFLQAQLGFSLGRPQNSFNEMRLSVCDSYTYCSRCVHPLSVEECKNVWICGEKKSILRMLWSTTVLQALEDVYTSGIIAEIPMQLEHWMVFEKPDPLSRFQWSKVNMNDKIQQIYESIVFWQVSTSWKWKLPLLSYKDILSKQHSFPLPIEARKVTGVFQRTGYRTQNWWSCKGHLKVI